MGFNTIMSSLEKYDPDIPKYDNKLKCIIAIGVTGKWSVLWHQRVTEFNEGLVEMLDMEESEQNFDFSLEKIKPGVYITEFHMTLEPGNAYTDVDAEYYGDFDMDNVCIPVITYPFIKEEDDCDKIL